MNKKSGVSMLVLIITIVVVIILMSTISLKIKNAKNNGNLSVFVNNLSVIEEYIESCNVLKEESPFSEDLKLEEVKAKVLPEYLDFFNSELISNGDEYTTSFKKVDMSKIGIKKKFTGYEQEGENDIYVYSEVTGTVYYLIGTEVNGEIYFSISDKVTNIVK